MQTTKAETTNTRRQKPWSKKLTPTQVRALINDYRGNHTTESMCERYDISRSTLYRMLGQYDKGPDGTETLTYLRAEVARLKELVVELAMANRRLRRPQSVAPPA